MDAARSSAPAKPASTYRPTTRPLSGPGHFCFVFGTHVSTLRGDIAVEDLRPGDQVKTKSGSYHIVTGISHYTIEDCHPAAVSKLFPVTIRRGALGDKLPRRDLFVTGGQQFESSQEMKIGHHIRMSPRLHGNALLALEFVVFQCGTATAVRVEGLWTTETPCAAFFEARERPESRVLQSA